jgi:hypothetical protein
MARKSGSALAALLACSTACATFAHGTRQEVALSSDPLGARVTMGGQFVGTTPAVVNLRRRDANIVLLFEKEGFHPEEVRLKRSISGWVAVDVLVGVNPMMIQGLDSTSQYPGAAARGLATTLGVDFLTGAAYKLPPVVRAVLRPRQNP